MPEFMGDHSENGNLFVGRVFIPEISHFPRERLISGMKKKIILGSYPGRHRALFPKSAVCPGLPSFAPMGLEYG
jgi:hypothetical protein